jgi:hypothetical protein
MTTASLDFIVKNYLLKKGYPLHWYMQFMVYAADCLREITFDDLRVINTKILPVNQTINAAELPEDYQDYVTVGVMIGQRIRPLVPTTTLNPLISLDVNQNYAEQEWTNNVTEPGSNENQLYYGALPYAQWFTVHYNDYGENIGRFFGLGAGYQEDTFQVFKERNQIQLDQKFYVENIVLQYVSDGQSADAASQVDPYAIRTIQAYIEYQMKAHNRTYNMGERQLAENYYIKERKILRARKSDWSVEKIKRIVQKNTMGAPKS